MLVESKVDFYPVGQGLFAYGEISFGRASDQKYSWVFDCGTSSSQILIDRALSDLLRRKHGTNPAIDLVCISHFDQDHVSGLVRILESFHVGILLLPLVPLWRRMGILAATPRGGSRMLQEFLLDPSTFVAQRASRGVDQVLYFQEGSNEAGDSGPGAEAEFDGPVIPTVEARGGNSRPIEGSRDLAGVPVRGDSPAVSALGLGGSIRLAGIWEFVPFSDPDPALAITPAFVKEVRVVADKLLAADLSKERQHLLARINSIYDKQFGRRNYFLRNLMSTFLYCGPFDAGSVSYLGISRFAGDTSALDGVNFPSAKLLLLGPVETEFGAGYLFTGDAFLNSGSRLSALCIHLGPARVAGIQCLQVMHHGALPNWHSDVPSTLKPAASIFSSDPQSRKYRHPNPLVWRSFLGYGREQVDKEVGVRFHAMSVV